jgi:DNA-binding response OmpR family regulator
MRYTFGDYTLDMQRYELCRAGIPLKLQPKVFDLLAYLTRHRDRVVTRQELFDALPDCPGRGRHHAGSRTLINSVVPQEASRCSSS